MASNNSTFKVFAAGLVLGVGVGAVAGAYLSGRGLSSLDTGPSKAGAAPTKQVGPRDKPPIEDPKDNQPPVIDQGAKPNNPSATPGTPEKSPDNGTPAQPQNPGDKPAGGPTISPPENTPANTEPGKVDPKSIEPK